MKATWRAHAARADPSRGRRRIAITRRCAVEMLCLKRLMRKASGSREGGGQHERRVLGRNMRENAPEKGSDV